MDQVIDGFMKGWENRWTNWWTDERMEGCQMDRGKIGRGMDRGTGKNE